jgi:hypothetical protein
MKVTNRDFEYLKLVKTIEKAPEQSERVPDSIAPAPDLNPTGVGQAQNQEDQAAKSEAAKLSTAAQESLIRGALEQKYIKGKDGSQSSEASGEQLSDSERIIAEQATGTPMDKIPDRRNESDSQDYSLWKQKGGKDEEIAQKMKDIGSVYGDRNSGTSSGPITGGGGGEAGGGGVGSEAGGGGGGVVGGGGIGTGSGGPTPEQREAFEKMAGYNQGPPSAKSKIDAVESRMPESGVEQRDGAVNKLFDNPFGRVDDPTASSDTQGSQGKTAGKYGSKESMLGLNVNDYAAGMGARTSGTAMVAGAVGTAAKAGSVATAAGAATAIGAAAGALAGGALMGTGANLAYKAITGEYPGETLAKVGEDERIAKQMEEQRKETVDTISRNKIQPSKAPEVPKEIQEAAKKKAEEEAKKKAAEEAEKKKKEEEKKKAEEEKKKSGTDYDQENYNRRTREKIGGKTGFDFTSNLPKAPKTSGDVDPADESTTDIHTSGKLGKKSTGWISQPADEGTTDLGGPGNVSRGGDVDFEDKAGWSGREMREDPADVMDGAPYNDEPLPPAANQPTEESSEESESSLSAQLLKNLRIKI